MMMTFCIFVNVCINELVFSKFIFANNSVKTISDYYRNVQLYNNIFDFIT